MRPRFLLLPVLAVLTPLSAEACSIIYDPTMLWTEVEAQVRREARRAVADATAIIDGEVIRPFVRGGAPALVRAHRIFKGPQQQEFEVGERHSCDIALTRVGERLRMILSGGPDIYYLGQDSSASRTEDRLLGSDRRRDWPYVAGTETAQ